VTPVVSGSLKERELDLISVEDFCLWIIESLAEVRDHSADIDTVRRVIFRMFSWR
jgi:hypothetical protein